MPDQLAHYIFARKVIAAADASVRRRISVDAPIFRVGTFGPDPLFNDPSPYRRAEGFEMHKRSGREALERMRKPIEERMPWAAEYAAGFFCHYALDRLCHPDILDMAKRGVAKHVAIEGAYDRQLMLREGMRLPVRLPMSASALKAAAHMYTRVGPGRLRADIEAFWQIRRFVLFGGGTLLSAVPGKLNRDWDGLIPHKTPSPELKECFARLDELLEKSVEPAARQLELYFIAIDQKMPLNDWFCPDFSGFQTQR